MRRSRKPAVIRGFAAATLANFVALAAHVTAGGQMPGMLGIAVPWMLSFTVSVLLAGTTLSLTRLSISVAVSQFLFHGLFVLGTITPSGAVVGHVHGEAFQLPTSDMSSAIAGDGIMWGGHAIAASLTILALYRGERLLQILLALASQAVQWVQQRIDAPLTGVGLPGRDAPRALADLGVPPGPVALATLRGRAPPRLIAF